MSQGHLDKWPQLNLQEDPRTVGPKDYWALGLLAPSTLEPKDYWAAPVEGGMADIRIYGFQDMTDGRMNGQRFENYFCVLH